MSIRIKHLEAADIPRIMAAFQNSEWQTPEPYFHDLLAEQAKERRTFLLAFYITDIAGFVTIKWQSDYPFFASSGVPEVSDLRILKQFRRSGIATALMDEAENRIYQHAEFAGLGVGLYADYGPAQQMYVRRGYFPDGHGLMHHNKPVPPGANVLVDDDLLLYYIKERPSR
jgi:GNAT superfamily N-acetyltransferase